MAAFEDFYFIDFMDGPKKHKTFKTEIKSFTIHFFDSVPVIVSQKSYQDTTSATLTVNSWSSSALIFLPVGFITILLIHTEIGQGN